MRPEVPTAPPPRERRAWRGRAAATATAFVAALLALAGCAGDLATQGEALRLLGGGLERAVLHEQYAVTLNAVGGLRPYTFTLTGGELPPGLALENGAFRGVPTEVGAFEVTVQVSDANLSRVTQTYTLQVVRTPQPRLVVDAPLTEVRGDVTLRVRLEDARSVTGVRSLISWDPEVYSLVEASPVSARRDVALLWQAEPGLLRADVAGLGRQLTGNPELFRLTLRPTTPPVRVQVTFAAEVVSASADPDRKHDYLTGVVGAAPRPATSEDAGPTPGPADSPGDSGEQQP